MYIGLTFQKERKEDCTHEDHNQLDVPLPINIRQTHKKR